MSRLGGFAITLGMMAAIGIASSASAWAQGTLTLTLTGQSMIRGDIRADVPDAVPVIKGLLKGDAAFTNFEAAVFDVSRGQTLRDGRFLSPPESLEALQTFGFNLVSLANNHSYDLNTAGIENTLAAAKRLGLTYGGIGLDLNEAEQPRYLKTPNGTIAFIGLASGLIGEARATPTHLGVNELRIEGDTPNAEDVRRILQRVREARMNADVVVISQHNHYYPGVRSASDFSRILLSELPARLSPPEWLKPWAHQLVDAGADVLAFHGPPFLHGVEIYKGKPIFYSLGNFIFQVPPETIQLEEPIMWESVVAYLEYQRGKLQAVRFQPIAMNKIGRGMPNPHDQHDVNEYMRTRGLPTPATGEQAKYLLERFAEFSRPFGTRIISNGTTAEIELTDTKQRAPTAVKR